MKSTYISPLIKFETSQTEQIIANSSIRQDVYWDDPQTPDNALVKENSENIWELDW